MPQAPNVKLRAVHRIVFSLHPEAMNGLAASRGPSGSGLLHPIPAAQVKPTDFTLQVGTKRCLFVKVQGPPSGRYLVPR